MTYPAAPSRRTFLRTAGLGVGALAFGSGALAAGCTTGSQTAATSGDWGTPLTRFPTEPFVRLDDVGEVPDLPKRVAYLQSGDAEFYTVWADNVRAAAESNGLEFVTANANFNEAAYIDGMRSFLNRGVGAMFVDNLFEVAERPVVREAMDAGVAVFTTSFGPATTQMLADQERVGEVAAAAMLGHIQEHFGGRAQILHINAENEEANIPKGKAIREAVAAAGGATEIAVDVVPDSSPPHEFGFQTMNTVLQANPEVNVVIGQAGTVLGGLAALEAAGVEKDPRWLLVETGGEKAALDAVTSGNSPVKISVAFALEPIGAIPGVFGADWLAGQSIPSVVVFEPIVLDSGEKVDRYRSDMADPVALIKSAARERYFTMLGNISYATRMSYYDGNGMTPNKPAGDSN